jgi:hypothetical protein
MTPRLPLETRRSFRIAAGAGLAAAIAFGMALPLGYLVVVLTITLLAAPVPPPGLKGVVALLVILQLTTLFGMLLGPVLTYVPVAGVLLALFGVGAATLLAYRPGGALIGVLMVLGSTIVAVVAAQSSAAAAAIVKVLMLALVLAIIIAHVVHLVFPEDAVIKPPAPPAPDAVGWIALRTALIMLPPLLAALVNPGSYIMLLLKGSALAQQADATGTRAMAREMFGSTAMGGLAALGLWWLLSLWPSLILLTLGMALMILLMARPMYGATRSRFARSWWQFAMVQAVVLIGPAVGDSAGGTDIQVQMLIRWLTFMALALYAAGAVALLDRLRQRPVNAGLRRA